MTITTIDKGALKCESDDGPKLGFPTHISSRSFRGSDTVAMKKSDGIIVNVNGQVSFWSIEIFMEHQGDLVAVGPWLGESSSFESRKISLKTIAQMIQPLRTLEATGDALGGLFTPAFRWLNDGGILIFPPKLAAWIRDSQTAREKHENWELWIHPNRQAAAGWSFSLGVLAWRAIHPAESFGSDPFENEKGELRRERIRTKVLTPLETIKPEIKKEVSEFISRALISAPEEAPTLDEWDTAIKQWLRDGVSEELEPEKLEERRQTATRRAQKQETRLKSHRWLRKSGWKVLVIVTAVVLGVAFLSAPIKKTFEKPETIGMSQMEVASSYYRAITSLDSELMDDCLDKKTGKDDLRMVNMVFVTQRVRQGYEQIGERPTATEWIAAGEPDPTGGLWPWGVSDLKLSKRRDGRIEAQYIFWNQPEMVDEANPPTTPTMIERRDILMFTQGRWSWEISHIERTQKLLGQELSNE